MTNTSTRLKTPPIRTGLHEISPVASDAQTVAGGSPDPNAPTAAQPPRIAKEWYYYWTALGLEVNQNMQTLAGLVTYGTHANRPDPSTMPDGALYVETDRHGVIYQNHLVQGKPAWVYSAGTMWGSISPDQRPTDLGPNDSGFEYRTTDQPPRQFLWSSTGWVEVTPVRYDTHANRVAAPISTVEQGMLWIETDRSDVIYQNQGGTWHYIAGIMWGTISPDGRPTDLGANDVDFQYRATDQPRQFVWSGTAWTETSPVGGFANLTHPNVVTRVGSSPGQIVEGGITDGSAADSGVVQITAGGNVGLGVSPAYPLHLVRAESSANLAGIQQFAISTTTLSGYATAIGYGNPGIGANIGAIQALAGGSGTLLALNPGGGSVAIGQTAASYQFQLSSDSAGKPGTSTWTVVSDLQLKRNIQPVTDDSLAILGRLDWVRFEYNGKAGTPVGANAIGLSAQQLREHLPEAVRSTRAKLEDADAADSEVLSIDYHHILVHAARAIQQLDQEVKRLKRIVERTQP